MKKNNEEELYDTYQRDGKKLVHIDNYTYEEIEEMQESLKGKYILQYFRGSFIIFKCQLNDD